MNLIKKLQDMQEAYGYLPMEQLKELDGSAAETIGTATFYEFFQMQQGAQANHIERLFPCRQKGALLNPHQIHTKEAIERTLADPEGAIAELKRAKLLGRGGAAFPTGVKWETTYKIHAPQKYVVCNADEGEPDTGKDRILLEENPEAVITGIALCAAAVGADQAYLYLRGEYADLKESLEATIQQLPLQDELSIQIFLGMGAYVCGEETALLESLEGKRGEPRLKPPFPGVAGLHQCPTVINNVETFACVAYTLSNGADAFLAKGDSEYPGYKLYTIAGAVEHPGVYEAEAGLSVGELLQLAGGMKVGQTLAAIQVGGGSGKLLHADALDLKMTPNDCRSFGTGLGTGSVRFFSEEDDLHEYVASRTEFYASESCGCCVPCRAGLEALTELLRASELDSERILHVAEYIRDGARCALAAAAITPVVSWLEGGFDHEN